MADSVALSLGSGHFGGGTNVIPFLGVKTRCIDKSTGEHYDTRQDNTNLRSGERSISNQSQLLRRISQKYCYC